MPLTTPQDQITFALKAIGVLGVGQTALAEDFQDAFAVLNGMMAQWSVKRWMVYHLVDLKCPTTGQQFYTVGPGGDFQVARATRLEAAYFRQFVSSIPNQVDFPLTVLNSYEDYAAIALKMLGTFPYYIFFDSDWPVGKAYPWPVPQNGYELHLVLKAHLSKFTSYVQSINLPDEYTETIWTNLAVRLPSIYPGSSLPDETKALAAASLETIRVANTQIPRLTMPRGLVSKPLFNIFSGLPY